MACDDIANNVVPIKIPILLIISKGNIIPKVIDAAIPFKIDRFSLVNFNISRVNDGVFIIGVLMLGDVIGGNVLKLHLEIVDIGYVNFTIFKYFGNIDNFDFIILDFINILSI